jgi:hypothetical protein
MHTFSEGLHAGSMLQSYVEIFHSHSEIDDSLHHFDHQFIHRCHSLQGCQQKMTCQSIRNCHMEWTLQQYFG